MDMVADDRIWRKSSKEDLRKWSATGPNDSILRPPLEKLLSLRTADVRNNPVVEKGRRSICSSCD